MGGTLRRSVSLGLLARLVLSAALLGALGSARAARANCNLIPAAPDEFRSVQGSVGNTVVAPGNPVRLRVDLACSPGARGFAALAADNQVTLRFVPPGSGASPALVTEIAIPAAAVTVANCGLGGGRCDTLRFQVPDAAALDAALAPAGDGLGPAGPAEVLVRAPDASLLARIGPLYDPTLACADQQPEAVFGHFTVLPAPNRFADLDAGLATSVRATLDGNGNLLIPFDYSDVLPGQAGAAVFRILQAGADVDAFSASPGLPVRVPAAPWVRSFSLSGRPIPPVLEVDSGGAMILGSVDALQSVLRLARLDPFTGAGPPLYDFSDRLSAGGRGPILIGNVAASARESAPLATLVADPAGISFARSESSDGNLNGDTDEFDRVPQVVDVASGAGFSTQQAVSEVSLPGYAKPALATGSGLVAMASSEARQGFTAANGDGDAFDSILRVFRTSGGEATLGLPATAVDPLPEVAGRTLAVSGPYVFFRTREGDGAPRRTENATPVRQNTHARADSQAPALSLDGRFLAFDSRGGSTFVPGLATSESAIWVLDRQAGSYERVTRDGLGNPLSGNHSQAGISADGRYVSYLSDSEDVPGADDGGLADVFLFDRQTGTTVCASCKPFLTVAAAYPDLAAGGRYLVFYSDGLVKYDRVTDTVQFVLQGVDTGCGPSACSLEPFGRASISGDGQRVAVRAVLTYLPSSQVLTDQVMQFTAGQNYITFVAPGFEPEISADGSAIAFQSDTGLVTDDNNLAVDAYVAAGGDLERVSLPVEGIETGGGLGVRRSAISDDGRFVSFVFDSAELAPGAGGGRDAYRYDRATNVIEGIDVDTAGTTWSDGFVNDVAISGDGRVTAFSAFSSNLAPDSYQDVQAVFVRSEEPEASANAADTDRQDTVLQVLDTTSAPAVLRPAARVPAQAIRVDGGRAAFLSSEAADGGLSRNGDGDAGDLVARAYDAATGQLHELGVAANRIDVSGDTVCLTVPESGDPSPLYDNQDGDSLDDIAAVWSFAAGGAPRSLGVTANAIQAVPGGCVLTSSEADEGGDRNGDGDDLDSVLRHWDGSQLRETGLAAQDFVARGDLVAFRVCEAEQGFQPRNGDQDALDCVMHVLRRSTDEVKSTGRAADRCELPGCDPFFEPFRVGATSVSFLTTEAGQGSPLAGGVPGFGCTPAAAGGGACDLNGDDDDGDELIAVYSVESERTQVITLAQDGQAPLPQPGPPFPAEQSGRTVLQILVPESTAGVDVNGDGQVTDAPVLVLIGDTDNDGTLDSDATGQRDSCVETPNAAQADADRDQLGDGACDPAPTPALPGDLPCDVDLDGAIDAADVALVFGDRGMAARASDPRDPDHDGVVTVLDVSTCSRSCTHTDCAEAPPGAGRSCGLVGAEVVPLAGLLLAWRRRARNTRRSWT